MNKPTHLTGMEMLSEAIDFYSASTANNPFLEKIADQPLTRGQWINFLRRRYALSIPFAGLLQKAVTREGSEIGNT